MTAINHKTGTYNKTDIIHAFIVNAVTKRNRRHKYILLLLWRRLNSLKLKRKHVISKVFCCYEIKGTATEKLHIDIFRNYCGVIATFNQSEFNFLLCWNAGLCMLPSLSRRPSSQM